MNNSYGEIEVREGNNEIIIAVKDKPARSKALIPADAKNVMDVVGITAEELLEVYYTEDILPLVRGGGKKNIEKFKQDFITNSKFAISLRSM